MSLKMINCLGVFRPPELDGFLRIYYLVAKILKTVEISTMVCYNSTKKSILAGMTKIYHHN